MKRALILGLVGVVFAGGTAWANSFTDTTTLSLQASPTHIDAGDSVSLSGTLSANHHFCEDNSKIKLLVGSTVLATTRTNDNGHYSFTQHPQVTTTYHTRFGGKVGGTHPNHKVCLSSRSPNKTVHVS